MKRNDNIEELFKEMFDQFEADVNPNTWNSIQGKIKSGNGHSSQIGAKSGLSAAKIISGIAVVGLISGTVWFLANQNGNLQQSSIEKPETQQNVLTKNSVDAPSSVLSSADNDLKPVFEASTPVSHKTDNPTTSAEKAMSEISSEHKMTDNSEAHTISQSESSQPVHKYGKATSGPTLLVRGGQPGNYDAVKSKTSTSKSSSSSENQSEEPLPTASIFASTISGDAPLTVSFANQGVASSTRWDFGDGTASSESSPEHTFTKAGTYVVYLNVRNSSSEQVSDKITIEVNSISNIGAIPNIFTPNGDGINDRFLFELKNIASINVIIYLKGQPVYKWNSLEGEWDGKTFSGADAPEGTYFYELKAIGIDGISHSKNGFIELSRKDK